MTVAVAHSSTPQGQSALRLAIAEALARSAHLVVIHVVDTQERAADTAVAEELNAALASELAAVTAQGLTWEVALVGATGDTAGAILRAATSVDADPLVIGTRRRSAVGKWLLGSTVQRVLLDASMPVLVTK